MELDEKDNKKGGYKVSAFFYTLNYFLKILIFMVENCNNNRYNINKFNWWEKSYYEER